MHDVKKVKRILLALAAQSASTMHDVKKVKRILLALAVAAAALAYVWVAAVRAVPGVRRRKAEARARRHR